MRATGRRGAATAPPPRRDTRNSPAQVVHTVALQTTASFVPDVPSHAARIERVEVLGLVDHEAAADAWAAAKKQLRKRCPGVVSRRVAVARGVKGREADFATAVRACYTLGASAPPFEEGDDGDDGDDATAGADGTGAAGATPRDERDAEKTRLILEEARKLAPHQPPWARLTISEYEERWLAPDGGAEVCRGVRATGALPSQLAGDLADACRSRRNVAFDVEVSEDALPDGFFERARVAAGCVPDRAWSGRAAARRVCWSRSGHGCDVDIPRG